MSKATWETALQLAAVACAGLLTWLLLHHAATTDGRLAVENALRQVQPADVESVTVYPDGPGSTRPFQRRSAAQVAPLLAALRQLAALPPNPRTLLPQPLATLSVRLTPQAVAAWHLRGRELIFRLSATSEGDIAQRATSVVVYRATALNRQVRQLRDSLAGR